ncbi:Molybdopterin synthase catalytic subunit [Psilocybe cubensis]|uniref:Molybdopterin synthase catalytic subunit n=2 Tax=Psilocybe cubensis TaxID=181762 RepID=A0ACB8HGE2_PSICU|nr:Molybdopterin synthase catalytic subunit [Psilocybe cubensis]KAH9486983.1 Molybdopterin synthase catalytic subunit [Psilocybe cubensis]
MALTPAASVEASLRDSQVSCILTYEPLDTYKITTSVQDVTSGATAVFIGTTRNYFKGKIVTRLEYQAYSAIAIKTMMNIGKSAITGAFRSQHQPHAIQPTMRCAIHHRLGTVPIGEASIVIAVSSPHRKEAFLVCEEILEQVKLKAQIWKREYYEGEDESEAEWKANF